MTLPKYLRKAASSQLIIAHFWHIPWPNYEAFRICPQRKEILEGLLANDLLGLHIRYHCDNFLDTVDHELNLLQTKADALREQKKGLMQQLLTGKIRVKP